MARKKDDPLLKQLFEGPDPDDRTARGGQDQPRDALRREVLGIIDAAGNSTAAEPLDEGTISAYLDGALPDGERKTLEGRIASSHALREQIAAAALVREAALDSGLSMPPAFIATYDEVPAPSGRASQRDLGETRKGFLGGFFGSPMPARRWLAAVVPVLAAVVVVAVVAPDLMRDDQKLPAAIPADASQSEQARGDKTKRPRVEERKSKLARDKQPKLAQEHEPKSKPKLAQKRKPNVAEAPKPKKGPKALKSEQAGKASQPRKIQRQMAGRRKEKSGASSGAGVAVLNTAIVPLNAELRNAVMALGRRQLLAKNAPGKRDEKKSADKMPETATAFEKDGAKRERLRRRAIGRAGGAASSRRTAQLTSRHRDVIAKAISPGCPGDPNACCNGHKVDRSLFDRLMSGQPPLQSVKVLQLSSRACQLTLP